MEEQPVPLIPEPRYENRERDILIEAVINGLETKLTLENFSEPVKTLSNRGEGTQTDLALYSD